jgi:hypothetical protein
MESVSDLVSVLYNHKWKTLFFGGVASLLIYHQYRQTKVDGLLRIEKQMMRTQYMEDAQIQSDLVVNNIFSELESKINNYSKVSQTRTRLGVQSNAEEKANLWEKLKVQGFVQSVCVVCCSCFLFLLTRVETNIIGHYIFKAKYAQEPIYDIQSLCSTELLSIRIL